jgi:hypothetical protein
MRYDEPRLERTILPGTHPLQSCPRGGRGTVRTCAMRYDGPRLVWTSLPITH